MAGIHFDMTLGYDSFIKGFKAIQSAVGQMSSAVQKAGGDIQSVFRQILDGGQTEAYERKARQIASLFNGLVSNIGLAGNAVTEARGKIDKALTDMANSTDKPKEKFRKFAEEVSAVLENIRSTQAPIANINNTSSISEIEKRLKLEEAIADTLKRQQEIAEKAKNERTGQFVNAKSRLATLESDLDKKYNGKGESFYSEADIARLERAREAVQNCAQAWDSADESLQVINALIEESNGNTERMKNSVESLNNVYKGFADTMESTATKVFISEDVFNRYNELGITIRDLKAQISDMTAGGDIDTTKLQSLQDQLAGAQEEFRTLEGAARNTAEVLGSNLASKVSVSLEKLYSLNASVKTTGEKVTELEGKLAAAKNELAEAKDPVAITKARKEVDDLTKSLDIARDNLSKFKQEQKDAVKEVQKLSNSVAKGAPDEGSMPDVTEAVTNQVKSVMGNIAAIAGIGVGLHELLEFFGKAKYWRTYFQDIESSMKVFLGSAEKGAEFTEKLQKYAYYNMFEFSELAAASQQMISYGHDVDSIIPRLDQLSNVATGTHGSIMELVDAYNRAKSTGVVDARGVQSWAVKGVMIKDTLREMGEVTAGTTITFEQLNKVLDKVTGEGGRFHNLMGEMMTNISAEAGQLADNLSLMFNEIGEKYEDVFVKILKIQGDFVNARSSIVSDETLDWGAEVLNKALDKIAENLQDIIGIIKSAVAAFGTYKAVMIAHSAYMKVSATYANLAAIGYKANTVATAENTIAKELSNVVSGQSAAANAKETATKVAETAAEKANTAAKTANTAATITLGNAMKGLTATALANPWTLIAVALAGLAYACYSAYEGIMTQEKAQRLLNDATDDFNTKMEEQMQKDRENIGVIQDKTASLIEQTRAYRELIANREIFAKFTKEEIAGMSSDQINNIISDDTAQKNEERIRNQVKAAEELQKMFAGRSAAWLYAEDSDIEAVIEKFGLLPEYAEQLKQSIDGFTDLSDWAYTLVEGTQGELQEYLKKEAEAGVVEGIKNGLTNTESKALAIQTIRDYSSQVGEKTGEIEKNIADVRARIERIKSGEEKTTSQGDQRINDLTSKIKVLEQELVKARGEIGKTFDGTLDKQIATSNAKVEDLEHKLSKATGAKKSEIEVKLKEARDERDTFVNIQKLIEAGQLDTELVVKITREAENAVLGDKALADIGQDYEKIDRIGQGVAERVEDVKKKYEELKDSAVEQGEESHKSFEQMMEDAGLTAEGIDNDFKQSSDDVQKEIDDLRKKLKDAKDESEKQKLKLEIDRKEDTKKYLQTLKSQLKELVKDPYNIKAKITAIIPDWLKKIMKEWFNIEVTDEEKEIKNQSEQAKEEGKEAQSRIDAANADDGKKTGAQWKKQLTKADREEMQRLRAKLKTRLTQKEYEETKQQLDALERKYKQQDKAAAAKRAQEIRERWKQEEEMEKLRLDKERAREDAAIALIKEDAKREREQREVKHRREKEDLKRQGDEILKQIYEQRKKEYELNHKDSHYELTTEGGKGWKALRVSSLVDAQGIEKAILSEFGKGDIMSALLKDFGKGNVDILARPFIKAAELAKKGWKDATKDISEMLITANTEEAAAKIEEVTKDIEGISKQTEVTFVVNADELETLKESLPTDKNIKVNVESGKVSMPEMPESYTVTITADTEEAKGKVGELQNTIGRTPTDIKTRFALSADTAKYEEIKSLISSIGDTDIQFSDAAKSIATVFSTQMGIKDKEGNERQILVTPILPDGKVLTEKELTDYISKSLNGAEDILKADTKGVVISVGDIGFNGDLGGERLYQLQEELYNLPTEQIEKIRQLYESIDTRKFSTKELERYNAFMATLYSRMVIGESEYTHTLAKENEKRLQSLRDFYKEYGTKVEQVKAVTESFDEKISDAMAEGDTGLAASLEMQKEKALQDLQSKAIMEGINWESVFQDIMSYDVEFLNTLQSDLEDAIREGIKNGISAADMKVLSDKLQEVKNTITEKSGGIFSSNGIMGGSWLGNINKTQQQKAQYEQRAQAASERANILSEYVGVAKSGRELAQQEYDKAVKGGNKDEIEEAQKNLDVAKAKEEEANKEADKAKKEEQGAQSALLGFTKQMPLMMTDTIIHGVNDNLQSANKMVSEWGIGSEDFQEKFAKFAESSQYATAAFDSLKSGDVMGTVYNLGEAFNSLGESFGLWSNSNKADVIKANEKLANATEINTRAIEKLSKIMEEGSISEAADAAEKMRMQYQANQFNALQTMLNNTGMYDGGQSLREDWNDNNVSTNLMTGQKSSQIVEDLKRLLGPYLTATEMQRLNQWAGLDEILQINPQTLAKLYESQEGLDVLNRLTQSITEAQDEGNYNGLSNDLLEYIDQFGEDINKKITEQLQEKITGTSFDAFRDSYKSTLMDMEADTDDFVDDITKKMQESFIEDMLTSELYDYNDRLKAIYKEWADLAEDKSKGRINNTEFERRAQEIRNTNEALAAEMMAQRDALAAMTGYDDVSSKESSGSINAAKAMSEDTANELVGRITATQIAVETFRVQKQTSDNILAAQIALCVSALGEATTIMRGGEGSVFSDILNQQVVTNDHLATLVGYNKNIYEQWGTKLDEIRDRLA